MSARRIFQAVALTLLALVLLPFAPEPAHARTAPRVLAFYYAWFDANTWSPDRVSDMPSPTYNSADPTTIARHIGQAQRAGIDAFVVSWTGPNNPTDTNFRTMLDAAQRVGFSATIDFEVQHFGSRDAVVGALSYVRDNFANQSAFMREGGKPVVFFWREQTLSVADWAAIRQAVDPDHQQVWIAEGTNIAYQQVFDGHHLYSIAWSGNPAATLSSWASRVRGAGADKLWVATVMPGYDDTRTDRADRFSRDRNGGDFYRSTWRAAINSNPDWIVINSFNEWVEGSQIEPSVTYGNLYLDLTRDFSAQFKSGSPPPAAPPAPKEPVATPTAAPISPAATPVAKAVNPNQRTTTEIVRVREGPGTDYETLGRLPANRAIDIISRTPDSRWVEISYPETPRTGWISAQYVAPTIGLDSVPVGGANLPQDSADWSICPDPALRSPGESFASC